MGALAVKSYRLGSVEVQAARQSILRSGESIYVRARTFQVLLHLLQHRDRLVSKQELFDALWGDTAVSDSSLVQCVIDLRKALGDDSRSPRYIKTVPKVGYQFIGPVEEVGGDEPLFGKPGSVEVESYTRYDVEYEETVEPQPKLPAPPPSVFRYLAAARAVVVVLAAALTAYSVFRGGPAARATLPHIEGRKPVAVMYFENQSGSPELEWLRKGLADILISDLSRCPSLTVLSRQELHLLLDGRGASNANQFNLEEALGVAARSHADVLVMGSFAKFGDRIRINVQLHDGHSGRLLTAESVIPERADRLLSDVDLLSLKLARDLGAWSGPNGEAAVAPVMTGNLEAFRYYSLAVEKSQAYHTRDAIALLEQAIALDPQFAMAQARIGYSYAVTWIAPDRGKPYLEKAFALSNRLTELDRMYISAWYAIANRDYPAAVDRYRELVAAYPRETEAYVRLGHLLRGEERFDEAIAVLKQGLGIDPDSKDIYNALGGIYSQQGRHDEALAMENRYTALAPTEANARDSLALVYQWAGRLPEAEREYLRAIELDPSFDLSTLHLGMLHFRMGRYRQALAEFQRQAIVAPSDLQRQSAVEYAAEVRWKMGDSAGALQELERCVRIYPDYPFNRMQLALWRKDRTAARSLVPDISRMSPWTHRGARPPYQRAAYYMRGQLALFEGENEKALEMFREALRHWSGWADFNTHEDCLGDAYLQLGRWDEAVAEYKRVLQLFPGTALARYHLASAYDHSGRAQLARAEFVRFLDLWKDAEKDIREVRAARDYLNQ